MAWWRGAGDPGLLTFAARTPTGGPVPWCGVPDGRGPSLSLQGTRKARGEAVVKHSAGPHCPAQGLASLTLDAMSASPPRGRVPSGVPPGSGVRGGCSSHQSHPAEAAAPTFLQGLGSEREGEGGSLALSARASGLRPAQSAPPRAGRVALARHRQAGSGRWQKWEVELRREGCARPAPSPRSGSANPKTRAPMPKCPLG